MKKENKIVFLMRGCPGTGKSFAAKKLAGNTGVVCETDSFFGPPGKDYHFNIKKREQARTQNMKLFILSVQQGISPVIVDRGCGKGRRTWWYAKVAQLYGYKVKLAEPTSPWWKKMIAERKWGGWPKNAVQILYEIQQGTHRVTYQAILRSIIRYDPTLTIKDILREGK